LDRKYCDIFECPLNLNGICSGWHGFSIATFCPSCMTAVLTFKEAEAIVKAVASGYVDKAVSIVERIPGEMRTKVPRGCPLPKHVQLAVRCKRCPLPLDERIKRCKWFRNLRERYKDFFIPADPTYFDTPRARRLFGL